MRIPAFVSRLVKMLLSPTRTSSPTLTDWPLSNAMQVLLLAPPAELPLQYRGGDRDIHLFSYPFHLMEIVSLVETWPSPGLGERRDRKYCEFITADREVRYFNCREMIDTLGRLERTSGKGLSRLRWVALDQFGYPDEAAALYRVFEQETGPTMTATGLARLMMNQRPQRALTLIEQVQRRGTTGAALGACHARVLFACGHVSEGTTAAALALTRLPDPLWMEADQRYSWGLLHGAAMVSRLDPALRPSVLAAIQSLTEPAVSAHRVLACAALFEAAGEAEAAAHQAEVALGLAQDEAVRTGATTLLHRLREIREGRSLTSTASKPAPQFFQESSHGLFAAPVDSAEAVVVTLGPPFDGPPLADLVAVQDYCRQLAESRHGALVEAEVVETPAGRAIQMIYKTRAGSGFQFTGTRLVPLTDATRLSSITLGEQGTTGVREAMITGHLMQEGLLTIETYKSSWARDPYDAAYRGPANVPLRFISDDVVYDRMFPSHPLTRVRRALHALSTEANVPATN
jgi:hypothetical protein